MKRIACTTAALWLVLPSARADLPEGYRGKPFQDEVHKTGIPAIPGIVQAALYDLGGEGVAYHDTTPANEGSGGLNTSPEHQRAHASPRADPCPRDAGRHVDDGGRAPGSFSRHRMMIAASDRGTSLRLLAIGWGFSVR